MFLGCDPELVVVCVVPYLGHVFPVGDLSVGNGFFEVEDSLLSLSLITYICFLLIQSYHDRRHFGLADYGGKLGSGGVLT